MERVNLRPRRVLGGGMVLASLLLHGCEDPQVEIVLPPGPSGHLERIFGVGADLLPEGQWTVPALHGLAPPTTPELFVYEPPGHDGVTPLPILYLLHGLGGDHTFFPYTLGIRSLLDDAIAEGRMEPAWVVMPNGLQSQGGSFFVDSLLDDHGSVSDPANVVFGPFARYLLAVMDAMESRYPFVGEPFRLDAFLAGERVASTGRGILGFGMGGYAALMSSIRAPVFQAIVAHSPFVDLERVVRETDPRLGATWRVRIGEEFLATYGTLLLDHRLTELADYDHPSLIATILAMGSAFSPRRGPLADFDMASTLTPPVPGADPDGDPGTNHVYPLRRINGAETPDESDDEWIGAALPMDASGAVVDAILLPWLLNHDPRIALSDPTAVQGLIDSGARVWLDVGSSDELGLEDDLLAFVPLIESSLPAGSVLWETYAGGHGDRLRERLETSIPWAASTLWEGRQEAADPAPSRH